MNSLSNAHHSLSVIFLGLFLKGTKIPVWGISMTVGKQKQPLVRDSKDTEQRLGACSRLTRWIWWRHKQIPIPSLFDRRRASQQSFLSYCLILEVAHYLPQRDARFKAPHPAPEPSNTLVAPSLRTEVRDWCENGVISNDLKARWNKVKS